MGTYAAVMSQRSGVSSGDVAWFGAELAVYVGVGWWGATQALPLLGRIALAVLAVTVMAVPWGVFAAPRAAHPLSGAAGVAFRVMWFGVGVVALVTVAH